MTEKEEKIGAAALQLFFRHGYAKTTMLDIAEAAGMSRPTLYASFENKEAILSTLLRYSTAQYSADSNNRLTKKKGLRARLEAVYDVWVIQPYASIADSENRADLLLNCGLYAPEATDELYAGLEAQLTSVLKPEMTRKRGISAAELAHTLATTTRGLKSTAKSLDELKRVVDALITMAVATVGA